jgi:hypothetical protein
MAEFDHAIDNVHAAPAAGTPSGVGALSKNIETASGVLQVRF